jgi:AbrB family looped-hinge helix DNA binding protein
MEPGSLFQKVARTSSGEHYHGNVVFMALARSKVTAQGQISIPASIRHRLGIAPGSILEWDEEGDNIVVRRSARFSSEDIHRALFPNGPPKPRTVQERKDGIRRYVRKLYARH